MLISLLCLWYIISCQKQPLNEPIEPPVVDTTTTKKNFELVWMAPNSPDTNSCISDRPYLVNGDLIAVKFFRGVEDVVQLFDGQTGKRRWAKSDPAEWSDGSSIGSISGWNDIAFVCSWDDIHAFDRLSGNLLWHSDVDANGIDVNDGQPRVRVLNDCVYHVHRPDGVEVSSAHLVRSSVMGGAWDTLYSDYKQHPNDYSPNFEMPDIWLSPEGDTLLIFQGRQYNFAAIDGRINLYALNLRTRELAWKIQDLVPEGNSSVKPPLVWHDRVFFQGMRTLFCIEAATGNILWQKNYNGSVHPSFLVSRVHVYDDRLLIAQSDNGDFYAFDVQTGAQVWKTDDDYGWDEEFVIYGGKIYAVSVYGFLRCINAANGKLEWETLPPARQMGYPSAKFTYGGVLLNPDFGYLYANDGVFWYCLKIL